MHAKSLQSCPTLCDPMDCSLPGFSFHGIFQARILEWFAMPSSNLSFVIQFLGRVILLWPHGLQHTRLPCSSPTPRAYSNSCLLSWWCHSTISYSIPFSSCLQSFPVSDSFSMGWLFASGGQTIGASASASTLSPNIQDWFLLGLAGLILLQSKRLSRVFSNTAVQKHQFFSTQLSLQSNSHIHTWLLGKP